jgi:choline dehydrogenase-like flavoprotein
LAIGGIDSLPDQADVCVIGAGPVGLALALSCARRGLKVLVVESGGRSAGPDTAGVFEADILTPQSHVPTKLTLARGLGGASFWWGGRCVPFDDIDFERRDAAPDAIWPLSHADIRPWYEPAAQFLGCAPACFSRGGPGLGDDADLTTDSLERWAPVTRLVATYGVEIARQPNLQVATGATATGLTVTDDKVGGVVLAGDGGAAGLARATRYVVAAGGLETPRLLLIAQSERPSLFGGPQGALGRYYVGHLSGKIADIELASAADVDALDYFVDGGCYARRRLTVSADAQRREGLLNAAFWLDNPPFHDPGHHSALLSAVWLALAFEPLGARLASPSVRRSHLGGQRGVLSHHLANVLSNPAATAIDLARIVQRRYFASLRQPGFLVKNKHRRYALHYHAEQAPNAESRLTLSGARDALGRPRLAVDFRYRESDIRSVLRSHAVLDAALRRADRGRLTYRAPDDELAAQVWAQAEDGVHQTGATRMGDDPRASVVDRDCRTHDLPNLYLAASSVFASSSQANPTLMAVALALRLADKLCAEAAHG